MLNFGRNFLMLLYIADSYFTFHNFLFCTQRMFLNQEEYCVSVSEF
jgi:hypothetical protein